MKKLIRKALYGMSVDSDIEADYATYSGMGDNNQYYNYNTNLYTSPIQRTQISQLIFPLLTNDSSNVVYSPNDYSFESSNTQPTNGQTITEINTTPTNTTITENTQIISNNQNNTSEVKQIAQLTNSSLVSKTGKQRKLYKDINPNCRDLGGLGSISYGKMFRGGLYGGDLKKIKNLGITHEITVTGNKRHLPVDSSNIYGGDWRHLSDKLKGDVLSKCMQWVIEGHKVYIHCDRGCDRTGVFCAILEGILGAPREDIISDFKLSDESGAKYKISHPDKTIAGYLKKYGGNSSSTLQQQINFINSVATKYGVDKNLMLQFIKAATNNGVMSAKHGRVLIFNPRMKTNSCKYF